MKKGFIVLAAFLLLFACQQNQNTNESILTFELSFPEEQTADALDGRMLLLVSNDDSNEPRFQISDGPGTQVVFVQGPYDTLVPLIEQLISKPIDERPTLVYWSQQSLCLPRPHWACELLSRTFSDLHQAHDDLTGLGKLANRLAPSFFTSRGAWLGFLGDMLWLSEHGLLDVLALSSTVYASYLRRFDIPSIVVPRGSAPSHGALLNSERDIAVVWMGKLRTKRRRRAIYWLKQQLERKGLGHARTRHQRRSHRAERDRTLAHPQFPGRAVRGCGKDRRRSDARHDPDRSRRLLCLPGELQARGQGGR